MKRLEGKIALVTGGGSGIGRGLALALAAEGARVAVCGRRQAPLEETVRLVEAAGGTALSVLADVSREADVERFFQSVLDAWGRVDIVINNAGIGGYTTTYALDAGTWDRVMAVNLRGPALVTSRALPLMRAQRSGHIINISSESGLNYYEGDAVYGLSKHALNDLGEYTQRENQEYGIRVNTICPGMVVSEMSADSPGLNHEKCLYPEDIADLALWLLTRRANIKIGTPVLIQTMENPWE